MTPAVKREPVTKAAIKLERGTIVVKPEPTSSSQSEGENDQQLDVKKEQGQKANNRLAADSPYSPLPERK